VQYFDDPEGKCELPQSLKATEWKRLQEFIDGFDKVFLSQLRVCCVLGSGLLVEYMDCCLGIAFVL